MRAAVSNLVTIIIALLAFIILGTVFYQIVNLLQGSSTDKLCQMSILKQAAIKDATLDLYDVNIECPRKDVVFSDNEIKVDGVKKVVIEKEGNKKKVRKFDTLNDYYVSQVALEQMYRCWENAGRGELKVFETNLFNLVMGQTKLDTICLICSQLDFDVDKKRTFESPTIDIDKIFIPSGDITYYKYFEKYPQPTYEKIFGWTIPWSQNFIDKKSYPAIFSFDKFDTDKDYVIYFTGFKPDLASKIIQDFDTDYFVVLSDIAELSKRCDYIVN